MATNGRGIALIFSFIILASGLTFASADNDLISASISASMGNIRTTAMGLGSELKLIGPILVMVSILLGAMLYTFCAFSMEGEIRKQFVLAIYAAVTGATFFMVITLVVPPIITALYGDPCLGGCPLGETCLTTGCCPAPPAAFVCRGTTCCTTGCNPNPVAINPCL